MGGGCSFVVSVLFVFVLFIVKRCIVEAPVVGLLIGIRQLGFMLHTPVTFPLCKKKKEKKRKEKRKREKEARHC